jgi:chemotaxis protein methyltransferase CheR
MDDQHFHSLLDHFGLSWSGYQKVRKGVITRVRKLMQEQGCPSVRQYLFLLRENHQARLACEQAMTVSVSKRISAGFTWVLAVIAERKQRPSLM